MKKITLAAALAAATLSGCRTTEKPISNPPAEYKLPAVDSFKDPDAAQVIAANYKIVMDREPAAGVPSADQVDKMFVQFTNSFDENTSAPVALNTLAKRNAVLEAAKEAGRGSELTGRMAPKNDQLVEHLKKQVETLVHTNASTSVLGLLAGYAALFPDFLQVATNGNGQDTVISITGNKYTRVLSTPTGNIENVISTPLAPTGTSVVDVVAARTMVTGGYKQGERVTTAPFSEGIHAKYTRLGVAEVSKEFSGLLEIAGITAATGSKVEFRIGTCANSDGTIPENFFVIGNVMYAAPKTQLGISRDLLKEAVYAVQRRKAMAAAKKGDFAGLQRLSTERQYGKLIISELDKDEVLRHYFAAPDGNKMYLRLGFVANTSASGQAPSQATQGLTSLEGDVLDRKPAIHMGRGYSSGGLATDTLIDALAKRHVAPVYARVVNKDGKQHIDPQNLNALTTLLGSAESVYRNNIVESLTGAVFTGGCFEQLSQASTKFDPATLRSYSAIDAFG